MASGNINVLDVAESEFEDLDIPPEDQEYQDDRDTASKGYLIITFMWVMFGSFYVGMEWNVELGGGGDRWLKDCYIRRRKL